jgi:hypothetical protein
MAGDSPLAAKLDIKAFRHKSVGFAAANSIPAKGMRVS